MGSKTVLSKELSILVSEDDQSEQFLLRQAINAVNEEIGINLVFSCEQLLDFLLRSTLERDLNSQTLPDLIIANYSMPFRDLKVIMEIRKKEQYKNTPIYVFVNENIQCTREKFLEYGVTEVLERPATFLALKKEIDRIIATVKT